MPTYYADFEKVATGDGLSEPTAYNWDQFKTAIEAAHTVNTTYNVWGTKTLAISASAQYNYGLKIGGTPETTRINTGDLIIQSYKDTPAKIQIDFTINYSGANVYGISFHETNVECKRLHIYQTVVAGSSSNENEEITVGTFCHSTERTCKFTNCVLVSNPFKAPTNQTIIGNCAGNFHSTQVLVILNLTTLINASVSVIMQSLARLDDRDGPEFQIDSCYFEGNCTYFTRMTFDRATPDKSFYKYSGFYNNASGAIYYDPLYPSDGGNNIDGRASGSQIGVDFKPTGGTLQQGDPVLLPDIDFYNVARGNPPFIGAAEGVIKISTLSTDPPVVGVEVTSTINITPLITLLADSYFTTINDFSRIDIIYQHTDGRQEKRIAHTLDGGNFKGKATWSSHARLGLWRKAFVRVRNHEGAIGQSAITGEDFTLV